MICIGVVYVQLYPKLPIYILYIRSAFRLGSLPVEVALSALLVVHVGRLDGVQVQSILVDGFQLFFLWLCSVRVVHDLFQGLRGLGVLPLHR
jgi:hypothetical protein